MKEALEKAEESTDPAFRKMMGLPVNRYCTAVHYSTLKNRPLNSLVGVFQFSLVYCNDAVQLSTVKCNAV